MCIFGRVIVKNITLQGFDAAEILLLKSHTKFPIGISGFVLTRAPVVFDSLLLALFLFIASGSKIHFVVKINSKSSFACSFTTRDLRERARVLESHSYPPIPAALGIPEQLTGIYIFLSRSVICKHLNGSTDISPSQCHVHKFLLETQTHWCCRFPEQTSCPNHASAWHSKCFGKSRFLSGKMQFSNGVFYYTTSTASVLHLPCPKTPEEPEHPISRQEKAAPWASSKNRILICTSELHHRRSLYSPFKHRLLLLSFSRSAETDVGRGTQHSGSGSTLSALRWCHH